MSTPALSGEETLAWVEKTSSNWRKFISANPTALALPCDIYKASKTAGGLLQHIAAVELRYAQRLAAIAETPYEDISSEDDGLIYATHDRAMAMVRELLADSTYDWDREIEFDTISLGRIAAPCRVVLFHMLLHSIRHYGQLATLVRQHGFKTGFPMDYIMMGARRA